MPQTINTNLFSLNAQRNLDASQGQLSTAMQRLSSGLRVNGAKDDAAGLAIAESMTAQVRGMAMAMRNVNDGISYSQVAEGALGSVAQNFQRLRELAVQAANGTNSDSDRANLNSEFLALRAESVRTLDSARFNGQQILRHDEAISFQVGPNATALDSVVIPAFWWSKEPEPLSIPIALRGESKIEHLLRTDEPPNSDGSRGVQLSSQSESRDALDAIDDALAEINQHRAGFGALQNRFESILANLQIAHENLAASRSRIIDADFAMETASVSRAQILQQAGNAMLVVANQWPQQVLSLLK